MNNRRYVHLDKPDLVLAFKLATARYEYDVRHGLRNKKVSERMTAFQAMHLGTIGEVAAAKMLCVPVSRDTTHTGMKDYDLVWCNQKVEVKTNKKQYPINRLHGKNILKHKYVKPDIFVLAVPDVQEESLAFKAERWLIAGWCTRLFYVLNHEYHNFNHGDEPAMPEHKLWHMDEMFHLDPREFIEMWTSDDETGETDLLWKALERKATSSDGEQKA